MARAATAHLLAEFKMQSTRDYNDATAEQFKSKLLLPVLHIIGQRSSRSCCRRCCCCCFSCSFGNKRRIHCISYLLLLLPDWPPPLTVICWPNSFRIAVDNLICIVPIYARLMDNSAQSRSSHGLSSSSSNSDCCSTCSLFPLPSLLSTDLHLHSCLFLHHLCSTIVICIRLKRAARCTLRAASCELRRVARCALNGCACKTICSKCFHVFMGIDFAYPTLCAAPTN